MAPVSKITPCLWFDGQAEEAARFYASVVPDSRVDKVVRAPSDYPSGSAGSVLSVEFTLAGQSYLGLNGGPNVHFNQAVSFIVSCDDQAEVDRLWDGLLAGGGKPVACGWLTDRYGLSWQVTPTALLRMIADPDRDKAGRAMQSMMGMVKLDIAALTAAFEGR